MIKMQPLSPTHPQFPELVGLALGNPTPEKIEETIRMYTQKDQYLFGAFKENNLIGCIGLQMLGDDGTLHHMAVLEPYQNKGVGKALIQEAISHFQLHSLKTETDEEGKGFYEKCGFICSPFQGQHNLRYYCEWEK